MKIKFIDRVPWGYTIDGTHYNNMVDKINEVVTALNALSETLYKTVEVLDKLAKVVKGRTT